MKRLMNILLGWVTGIALLTPAQAALQDSGGVPECLYVPGVSVPATLDASLTNPLPADKPVLSVPPNTPVDAAVTEGQLEVFRGLWNAVNDHYVYTDFRGRDWAAIGTKYEALVRQGFTESDFYVAMQSMLNQLGDQHSYVQSPTQVMEEEARLAEGATFVGVGVLAIDIADTDSAVIISILPDSPASEAGLLSHDVMVSVDGGPVRDEFGVSRTRGPEGTQVTITIQRLGEPPRDVVLTRRQVNSTLMIDYCLIPNTRIGYILLPTLLEPSIDEQIRQALRELTSEAPLQGLILDNRVNGGGSGEVAQNIMGFFTGGSLGYFVTREGQEELVLQPEDVGGSQSVPLVILVDADTISYAEIISGVLRLADGAVIVGEPTLGNVEQLRRYDFPDGSRAWIASATFEPIGQAAGIWEETGIIPDVMVPMRWDLFTQANDPGIAMAVQFLTQE